MEAGNNEVHDTTRHWRDSHGYPLFNLTAYRELIRRLSSRGYAMLGVDDYSQASKSGVFLRHDVDFHLHGIERLAEVEAECGVSSVFYIATNLCYNPASSYSVKVVRRLVELGAEIGLHYDLTTYPDSLEAAKRKLVREAGFIEDISGKPVRSITMHQPHKGTKDDFMSADMFMNPHDPRLQEGCWYLSDSCRAWRDERLLQCLDGRGPSRLHLNTHPELWLGRGNETRHSFLGHTVLSNATREIADFLNGEVHHIWKTHAGAIAHDQRARHDK